MITDNERQPNPPELSSSKQASIDALEDYMSDFGGLMDEIETRETKQEAIELLRECISEQLPYNVDVLYNLILKMGWEKKAYDYLHFKKEVYIEHEIMFGEE